MPKIEILSERRPARADALRVYRDFIGEVLMLSRRTKRTSSHSNHHHSGFTHDAEGHPRQQRNDKS